MVLTGMLIYVPSTSRAGIATLVCVVACCNLNYFQPQKNKILFWLTQISFVTTTAKYVIALLLSVESHLDLNEQATIGKLMIGLDVFFLISSGLAILTGFCVLYVRIKQIQRDTIETSDQTHIVPIDPIESESVSEPGPRPATDVSSSSNFSTDKAVQDNKEFIRKRQASTYQKATILEEKYERSEEQLLKIQAENAEKHRLHTQDRIAARLYIRQTKTLTKVKLFEKLKTKQIEAVLEQMTFDKRLQGDVICKQGDDAQRFYVIVTGRCDVIIKTDDGSDLRVNTLGPLEYFGESSLIGSNMKRNATVVVASENLQVLCLGKTVFEELVESGVIENSAFEHAKELAEARANIRYSHVLQKTKMFRDLSIDDISKIIDVMEMKTYKKNEHLMQQGGDAASFLVILQGTASVLVDGNEVRTFKRLDFMGEAALVNDNHKRTATVTATKLVHALILSRLSYMKLLDEEVISQKTHAMAQRMSMDYTAADAARLLSATHEVTVHGENFNDGIGGEEGEEGEDEVEIEVEYDELSISDIEEMENEEED